MMTEKQLTVSLVMAAAVATAASGCYDFEDGSIAKILGEMEQYGTDSDFGEQETEWYEWTDCPNDLEAIDFAKSGDNCSFNDNGSCGYAYQESELPLFQHAVTCSNGRLVKTRVESMLDSAPDPEETWSDCSAIIDGGRSGESCDQAFSCYREKNGNCLEIVDCDPSSALYAGLAGRSGMTHLLLCDEIGTLPEPSETVYDNCNTIAMAAPLDACEGRFMCQAGENLVFQPVPSSNVFDGYGLDGEGYIMPHYLVSCDGERLHFYNYLYGIM